MSLLEGDEAGQPDGLDALNRTSAATSILPTVYDFEAASTMSTILRTLRNLRRIGFKVLPTRTPGISELTESCRSMATRCRYEQRKLRISDRHANVLSSL